MILRSVALKYVAGNERPTSFELSPGATFLRVEPELVAALPYVLLTLLYPDEVSSSDLARLAGPRSESGWRAEFDVAGTQIRLSRGFSAGSVLLEERRDDRAEWKRVAVGASDVRLQLADRLKLPPPSVFEGLHVWINVCAPERAAAAAEPEPPTADDELQLVGTDDYFGDMLAGGPQVVALNDEDRARVGDEFRRARTAEFIADQTREMETRLEEAIQRLGAVVDETGDLARIQRALSDTPELRDLEPIEREALTNPEMKRDEFERRITKLTEELASAGPAPTATPTVHLTRNALFMVGLGLTIGVTVASVAGGEALRKLAFGNLVAMGILFAGYLRHLQLLETGAKTGRRSANIQRRLDTIERERREFERRLEALRDELGVSDIIAYDDSRARRAQLLEKEDEVRQQHLAAFESEEYRRMERRKERVEAQVRALRQAATRIGEPTVEAYELQTELERAGLDPTVALWKPDPDRKELDRNVKRLGQIASKYRLISESGLHPKTVKSWLKVASRILGRSVEGLGLTPEHVLVDETGEDALPAMPLSEAIAVVEALRMSLHLTLVKASAPGIHGISLQAHPMRVPDPEIRARLRKMYNGLGEKLQVVCIDVDA